MTRLAFDLERLGTTSRSAGRPSSRRSTSTREADTFASARLWDYRARSRTTLDQLQTVRRTTTSPTSTPTATSIDGIQRQVMLVGSRAARSSRTRARPAGSTSGSSTPTASAPRWCRSTRSAARASRACSSATCRRSRRPARRPSPSRASTSASGRRRTSSIGAQQAEFDYPTGESDDRRLGRAPRRAGRARPGSSSTRRSRGCCSPLRFRDLDLLISDQVTADSQLLFHRSLSDRLTRIAPFLRYDKDPYLVIDDAGRLVYIQDAFTTSDRFPDAQAFDPALAASRPNLGSDPFNYIRNSVKITVDAYDGTMHFYVARSGRPDHPGLRGRLPDAVRAARRDAGRPARPPAGARGAVQRPDPRVRPLPRDRPLQFFRGDDLWTVPTGPDQRADDCRPRRTTSRCACPGETGRRVPAPPADGPDRAGRT